MNKKLIVCIIVTLLFTAVIPIIGTAEENKNKTINDRCIITVNNNNGDILDQYQNSTSTHGWGIVNTQWLAQSFTPSLNILTRVQLYLFKAGTPPGDAEIVFSIRESLTGDDLTSITLKSDKLPSNSSFVWIEFDFNDINVTPNSLYYLICKGTAGDNTNLYCWLFKENNPYKNGEAWFTLDHGESWYKSQNPQYPDSDCCFKTYGYNNNPPNTPTITGETEGKIQTSYDYIIQTTDPDQNDVKYQIDWGDNTTMITGLNASGEKIVVSHTWDTKGTYNIKVKAIDKYGAESDWRTLTVTMPCSYNKPIPQYLELVFQRFPDTFSILRHLLGY